MEHLFISKVDVKRITRASDGMGGWTETTTRLHKDLPCRINWVKGSEKIMFDKVTYYRDGKLFCKVINVTTDDIITYSGKDYDIVDVSNVDNLNRFLVVDIKLIE